MSLTLTGSHSNDNHLLLWIFLLRINPRRIKRSSNSPVQGSATLTRLSSITVYGHDRPYFDLHIAKLVYNKVHKQPLHFSKLFKPPMGLKFILSIIYVTQRLCNCIFHEKHKKSYFFLWNLNNIEVTFDICNIMIFPTGNSPTFIF